MFPTRRHREFRHSGLDPESSPTSYNGTLRTPCIPVSRRYDVLTASAGMTFVPDVCTIYSPVDSAWKNCEIIHSNGIKFLPDCFDAFAVHAEIRASQSGCRANLDDV